MKSNFLIADISWNPNKWKDLYINPKAGHKYAREYPGHESLNFKFDKKGIDTENEIFGFIQWKNRPVKFLDGGIIIFYSNNTDIKKGQIVGIYTNVEILNQRKETIWEGFKDNLLNVNIKADKELSMLFPVLLDANLYKQGNSKRITGQVGYSYYDLILAKKIIEDELLELYKKEDFKNEFEKLEKIYIDFISRNKFEIDFLNKDEVEQEELITIFEKEKNKSKIIEYLSNLKVNESEKVIVNHKTYKRDNKTVAYLKIYREFKCQICKSQIKKKDGGFYIEAAHIIEKNKKGRETPDNLLILCPNHHKEFDYGKKRIIKKTKDFINFEMNNTIYELDLRIKSED